MIQRLDGDSVVCADTIDIGKDCIIGKGVRIVAPGGFRLGAHSMIGDGLDAVCRSITIGEHACLRSGVVIGKGGRFGPASILTIGDKGYVGEKCIFNVSETIAIGDEVGIGEQTNFWTHGAFPPVNLSFPAKFGSIKVHNRVWIQGRSIILPGVIIERGSIVGMGAVVTKRVEAGKFVAGVPARVVGESRGELTRETMEAVVQSYTELATYKKLDVTASILGDMLGFKLYYIQPGTVTAEVALFRLDTMTIVGNQNRYTEDFRDFLRRRGFKFWTGKRFESILPPSFTPYREFL